MSPGPHDADSGASTGPASDYERELNELRRVLDESPVVGYPRRDAELAELRRLIERYPAEARAILREGEDRDQP